jgi:hypothetical protein
MTIFKLESHNDSNPTGRTIMKNLCALIILFFSLNSFAAGFLFEPLIGFDSTTTTATRFNGSKANASSSGIDYGARLGYRFGQNIIGAAEYIAGSGKDDLDDGTKYKKSAMGIAFGYDLGKYIIWGGYGFTDDLIYETVPELTLKGTNFKIGFGYEVSPRVNLNLDLVIPKYTKAAVSGGSEVDISTVYSKFSVTTLMFSVSFPLGSGK